MYYAFDKNNKRINVKYASSNTKYFCPECGEELLIRNGSINAHHFAHKKGSNCCIASDMSDWHIWWQNCFPDENQEIVVERNGKKRRADVVLGDTVIEFQKSSMSKEEFNNRNRFYISCGYKVIWVFDFIERNLSNYDCSEHKFIVKWRFSTLDDYSPYFSKNVSVFLHIGCKYVFGQEIQKLIKIKWKPNNSFKIFHSDGIDYNEDTFYK